MNYVTHQPCEALNKVNSTESKQDQRFPNKYKASSCWNHNQAHYDDSFYT